MGGGGNEVPYSTAMKTTDMMRSICEIFTKNNQKIGLGFFLYYSESSKYLIITCYENYIDELNKLNEYIEIKSSNAQKFKLNLQNRYIKYVSAAENIIIIEIKDSDELNKKFEFLDFDKDYVKGYNIYNKVDIISLKHPFQKKSSSIDGTIDKIINSEFKHDISIEKDSIGCPIILLNDNKDSTQVIGIHKNKSSSTKANGIFIGEIIEEIKKNKNDYAQPETFNEKKVINQSIITSVSYKKNIIENYIIAEINIEDKDVNQDIRIINSYEEYMTNNYPEDLLEQHHTNEDEIKQCQIEINDMPIPFSYFYKFRNKGKYTIKYSFLNPIKKINYLFIECSNLTSIDLSKFDTKEVDDMSCIFADCSSLQNINLSNINTEKVIDMGCMFYECGALTNINLSSFNTGNVKNMGCMFKGCKSLTKINLSNFNTENVIDMGCMFKECSSLAEINLSNFNTKNVINMIGMFQECSSLTDVDLSSFNTENTINMNSVFKKCKSLNKIDISNFVSTNVTDMDSMFYECNYIEKRNFKTQDKKIFQEFEFKRI